MLGVRSILQSLNRIRKKSLIRVAAIAAMSVTAILGMPGVAQAAAWHPFGYLGVPENVYPATEGIGLTARATGELDVFMIDGQGRVWHRWWLASGGWRAWGLLGLPDDVGGCGPVAAAAAAGRLHILVMDCDQQLVYRYWSSSTGWVAWGAMAGPSPGVCWFPGAGGRFTGHVDFVVIGCDGNIWHRTFSNGVWSGWANRGRPPVLGGVDLTADIDGRTSGEVDIFAAASNGEVWHRWWLASGGWRAWNSIGEPAVGNCGSPGSVGRSNGELSVAVPGCDGNVYVRTWRPSGGWGGWGSIGHPTDMFVSKIGPPQLANRADGTLDVVARFAGGYPYHAWYG